MQYYSLQHWTLLSSPDTSTTGHCFQFGSASSFLLELFLCSSPVGYWAPTNVGSSSFSVISFCLFVLFMGFSRQEYCSGLPFLLTFCQNSPPWPVRLGWPYIAWLIVSLSYTRLWSMWSVWLVFCGCGFHSVWPLIDEDKRLVEAFWWEWLAVCWTGSWSALVGWAIFSKSLIQFSSDV